MKIWLISDVHGNWPALQAVLQPESDADRVLCLGDLVNYGPHVNFGKLAYEEP